MTDVRVEIPYQEKHSRLSVLLRPILAIPVIVVMLLMIIPNQSVDPVRLTEHSAEQRVEKTRNGRIIAQIQQSEREYYDLVETAQIAYIAIEERVDAAVTNGSSEGIIVDAGLLVIMYLFLVPLIAFSLWFMYVVNIATAMTLLFRKKYPSWWFNWNQSLQSLVLRIYTYSLFLTDKYPSLEAEDSPIKLHLPDPKTQNLHRVLPLVKWILVIPYLVIYLVFLVIGFALVPLTFVSILLTGKLPRWIYRFQVAVINFYIRIAAYAFLLVTDKWPKMIFRR
ncbi:MAG: DUF4389 domain-containing protein [Pseudomonadota bacterium]|nr:DUF4389 domain-containing protein [Pseudomonadota bacterium]